MTLVRLAAVLAIAACGPETTSFRTTDDGDGVVPGAAAYQLPATAALHVWSNGGYIGSSDEPMTHVGFEIRNIGVRPIAFDTDALDLALLDRRGAALPAPMFVAVAPLGPALVTIAPGQTVTLDAYFKLALRPRAVAGMKVRWTLVVGGARYVQTTSFVRDDDFPIVDRVLDLQAT